MQLSGTTGGFAMRRVSLIWRSRISRVQLYMTSVDLAPSRLGAHPLTAAPQEHVGLPLFVDDAQLRRHARGRIAVLPADDHDFVYRSDAAPCARGPRTGEAVSARGVGEREAGAGPAGLREKLVSQVRIVITIEADKDLDGRHGFNGT